MEFLQPFFLSFFLVLYSIIFPVFKQPIFATYVVILILIVLVWFKLYHYLKAQTLLKSTTQDKLRIGFLWTFEVYLTLMIFWYVFDVLDSYSFLSAFQFCLSLNNQG